MRTIGLGQQTATDGGETDEGTPPCRAAALAHDITLVLTAMPFPYDHSVACTTRAQGLVKAEKEEEKGASAWARR
jgi:hypothetical protein